MLAMTRIPKFHVFMAGATALILALSVICCTITSVKVDWAGLAIAIVFVMAGFMPIPVYWHDKQRHDMREAAVAVLWALLLAVILPTSVDALARLGRPLQDATFYRFDRAMGADVSTIVHWSSRYRLGALITRTYPLLLPLLACSVFAPGLTGRWRDARIFLVANLLAFGIGLPLFAMFPAIGPWVGYHFATGPGQLDCQSELMAMRAAGPYTIHAAGVVCFPSFHVIWAILCGRALWNFRVARIPLTVLCGMIVASTLTTGWHYLTDVVAGVVIAAFTLLLAEIVCRRLEESPQSVTRLTSQYSESSLQLQ
jgi:hypothetical protein